MARFVLALPPCMICDHPAEWETWTRWDCTAYLCGDCLEAHAIGDAEPVLDAARVPPLPTADEARAYLASQTWKFARTMPKWPHEYVLARRSTNLWGHLRTVAFIRAHGEPRKFGGRTHCYWQPGDGREYWTMRPTDTILNRRELTP
jgi:hypothetical protein